MNTKDGTWHAGDPKSATITVYIYGNPSRRPGWRGYVFRWTGETWLHEMCPHDHHKRSAAVRCAKAAAGRLNRRGAETVQDMDK